MLFRRPSVAASLEPLLKHVNEPDVIEAYGEHADFNRNLASASYKIAISWDLARGNLRIIRWQARLYLFATFFTALCAFIGAANGEWASTAYFGVASVLGGAAFCLCSTQARWVKIAVACYEALSDSFGTVGLNFSGLHVMEEVLQDDETKQALRAQIDELAAHGRAALDVLADDMRAVAALQAKPRYERVTKQRIAEIMNGARENPLPVQVDD